MVPFCYPVLTLAATLLVCDAGTLVRRVQRAQDKQTNRPHSANRRHSHPAHSHKKHEAHDSNVGQQGSQSNEQLNKRNHDLPPSRLIEAHDSQEPAVHIPRRCHGTYATKFDSGRAANMSRADQVRDAIRHLWNGYKEVAWGSDEVKPISGQPRMGDWGDIGMNILDSLDTLWLAGMHAEFAEGEQWVASMKLDARKKSRSKQSFFETTIRALGGLLSAYALSGHQVLLDKASELGRSLQHAFPERGQASHLWPATYINLREPSDIEFTPGWLGKNILADAGSNILEFDYLSEATGDDSLRVAADENEARLIGLAKKTNRHLAATNLLVRTFDFGEEGGETIGALADSYFEYLLKGYLQSGGKERQLLDEWKLAMQQMRTTLVRKSKGGLTFVATKGKTSAVMDHLSCFVGGLLALGSRYVAREDAEDWWLPLGEEITRSCYEMYRQSPSGLAPDISAFGETVVPVDRNNWVRPETLESLFYLYRITRNETYRQWSWDIFEAINKHTRTEYGFASPKDVTCVPVPLEDREQTFVAAETFKYALLIHLPDSTLPLDRFVLNTEAHPIPIQRGLTKARIDASEGIRQAQALEASQN